MATPTVYGSKASVATRRVLLTLTEKNVEYNFVAMNLAKGEQKVAVHQARKHTLMTGRLVVGFHCQAAIWICAFTDRWRFRLIRVASNRALHRVEVRASGTAIDSDGFERTSNFRTGGVDRDLSIRTYCCGHQFRAQTKEVRTFPGTQEQQLTFEQKQRSWRA